jgi:BMFP domain-containing protein YqiC
MSIPQDTVYPGLATNTEWQKKKSYKDKLKSATKTGLGAKLKTAEQAWAAIKWQYLKEVDLHPRPQTAVQAESNLNRARLAMHQVETTRAAVTEAHSAALQAANNQVLTQTARDYATNIAQLLQKALNRLAQVNIDDFEGQYETLAEHEEDLAKQRRKLTNVRVIHNQHDIFIAAQAKRVSDNRVEIEAAQWAEKVAE